MLGVYNYTVILTYFSMLSAVCGIWTGLTGSPYTATVFLIMSGLFDAFDGKVARTKKNRTPSELKFGIQIDSLSDLVAFGVQPACIGAGFVAMAGIEGAAKYLCLGVLALYALAALIRLAYFNVAEEERQSTEGGKRKCFEGLPVTVSASVLPAVAALQYVTAWDLSVAYIVLAGAMGVLFLSPIRIPKCSGKGIAVFIAIGAAELLAVILGGRA